MTKLKTLKDIDVEPFCHGVSKRDLKSEAVKWFRELRKDERARYVMSATAFILDFFNITEEDLQEEFVKHNPVIDAVTDGRGIRMVKSDAWTKKADLQEKK